MSVNLDPSIYLEYPELPYEVELVEKINRKHFSVKFVLKSKSLDLDKDSNEDFDNEIFSAKLGQSLVQMRKITLGLGELEKLNVDDLANLFRNSFADIAHKKEIISVILPASVYSKIGAKETIRLLVTALGISSYSTRLLKTKNGKDSSLKLKKVYIQAPQRKLSLIKKEVRQYTKLVKHINACRQVQSLPGNYFTATAMEYRAKQIAKKYDLKLNVYGQEELEKMGAGGILAVNQGSVQEPRMLVLEYAPDKAKKTLALIGKGVTFDSGGISIKPSSKMHEMKYDMSGSAAVVHSIAAIAEMGIKTRVIAAVGMVENMPSGKATKPGDVYTALNGLTIEVQNTDAEGRLVLGDLLHYVEKNYSPDMMVDVATLTGAILISLSQYYAGLFTNDMNVRDQILKASSQSLEPVWHMPMNQHWKNQLESDIADYNNISASRYGGSSTAAAFLSLFVEKTPWAHLDIAGVGFIEKSHNVYPKVGTGYGVRLLTELAQTMA